MENSAQRTRNRRGEGSRLRDEIIAAATALLEESGSVDAITLRGVARQAGVSAPSIYPHFADREAIVAAVIAGAFGELDETLAEAQAEERGDGGGDGDPWGRLRGLCEAYLDFAERRPQRYRVAFDRYSSTKEEAAESVDELLGGRAFMRLVGVVGACVRGSWGGGSAGGEDSVTEREVAVEAAVLWVGLHGYASLSASVPAFPWPARAEMVAALVGRVGWVGRTRG